MFRIHYMDAAAEPPHGFAPQELLAERPVDLHIACVPGFDFVSDYPEELLRTHGVGYVVAAHWEDFFQPIDAPLRPVPVILGEGALNAFVQRVEAVLGSVPRNAVSLHRPGCTPESCGPAGANWLMPVPGETLHIAVNAKQEYAGARE